MALIVDVFPARDDNYGYLVHDEATGRTAAIDAPETAAIEKALKARGWTLTDILITHHHIDHVEAIADLKASYGARVVGPKAEADKIEGLDELVGEGDIVSVGDAKLEVFATPGHTLGHIVFYNAEGGHLFSADALFSLGVGRMFEGTPGPMWDGVKRLRDLPDATLVYCGHEYTASNARFALSIDPNNAALQARAAEVTALRDAGKPTIPFNLGEDKKANPFLRADAPELAQFYGLSGADAGEVFGAIRKGKDTF
ncbi:MULTISPECIES: hydroxyacylglutathione hydrolase [unclassified Devosia]|uniref:hydroxyacylglutathione hydrolase n=1 Tax=unclassified Devosia TaxID=196773 RepID=UPI00145D29ED|nr:MULTISPECIES: hydroxyacylglutathione hydrolase [unclassified Devosia]MBJ6987680.1 hydroxyacylglutathione hydrolase [Devosia sp. MC521]QMW62360.1 hydroxyacylglutathione hydrolase [Devosia sp. MC521]